MQKFSHLKSSGSHCGRWRVKGRMGAERKGAERSGKAWQGAARRYFCPPSRRLQLLLVWICRIRLRLSRRCRSVLLTFAAPDSHYAFYSCHAITCQKGKFVSPAGIAREIGSVLQQCAVHLVHELCPGGKFAFGEFLGCGAASGQLLFYYFLSGRLVFSQLFLRPLLGGKLSYFSFHVSPGMSLPVWFARLSRGLALVLNIASICPNHRGLRTPVFS